MLEETKCRSSWKKPEVSNKGEHLGLENSQETGLCDDACAAQRTLSRASHDKIRTAPAHSHMPARNKTQEINKSLEKREKKINPPAINNSNVGFFILTHNTKPSTLKCSSGSFGLRRSGDRLRRG